MDDIIAAGSAAAAASPGFVTQDETVDLSGGMDGELGYVYGEDEQEEDDDDEEEPAPVPAKGRKKKKQAARSGEDQRIDKCQKWAEVRHTLDKAKETYKPDTPTPGASEGRPDGNKGAKKGKHADAATARVHESIEHCLADTQARAVLREEKTDARWSALMSSSAVKLDLLRTNVAAKKRNTDLASSATPPTPPPSPRDDASTTPSSTEAAPTPRSAEAAPTPLSPRTPTPPTPGAEPAE
nr:neurofilament medium polypeptide-like [Aegilops tauschii subsp. strangulata]